jgi:hypothetical protein
MLVVHAGIPLPRISVAKGTHDISNLRPADMLETLETICQHKSADKVWIGFLDPLWMLTEPERIRMRDCIRKLDITMTCSNPRALPYSWKAEISELIVYENEKPFTKRREE